MTGNLSGLCLTLPPLPSYQTGIDDSLYSRQRYVLGDGAMKRMAQSNVFLAGLGGLGVETGGIDMQFSYLLLTPLPSSNPLFFLFLSLPYPPRHRKATSSQGIIFLISPSPLSYPPPPHPFPFPFRFFFFFPRPYPVAKNIALAGVKSLTLNDASIVCVRDLGTQFFITAADVMSGRSR